MRRRQLPLLIDCLFALIEILVGTSDSWDYNLFTPYQIFLCDIHNFIHRRLGWSFMGIIIHLKIFFRSMINGEFNFKLLCSAIAKYAAHLARV